MGAVMMSISQRMRMAGYAHEARVWDQAVVRSQLTGKPAEVDPEVARLALQAKRQAGPFAGRGAGLRAARHKGR
jgi:hypothetical protein